MCGEENCVWVFENFLVLEWFLNQALNFLAATDKVALLIGNLNYSNHPALMAPVMDVHELGNLLRQLGFRVVSLLDLTREEMLTAIEKFIHLLDKGVYGERYNFFPAYFFWKKLLSLVEFQYSDAVLRKCWYYYLEVYVAPKAL